MSGKEHKETTTNKQPADSTDAIDSAINAARDKLRGEKASGDTATTDKPKKAKLTDEEKAAKQAQRDAERAQKRADREAKKAAKQAEREANKKPAHLSKVNKAGEKLPKLSDSAQETFDAITGSFDRGMVAAIALHLQHFNRVKATERALEQKLADGDSVRIVGGDPRYIGREGTVAKAQRIRCYVSVPGVEKQVYLFTSDVEKLGAAEQQATGTEG